MKKIINWFFDRPIIMVIMVIAYTIILECAL